MASKFLLVDSEILPEVFLKTIEAKRLIAEKKVKNLSAAAKAVGISRSALYKYKDRVFETTENKKSHVTISVVLKDVQGTLQNLLKLIAAYHINVITITQSAPSDGTAAVSLDLNINEMTESLDTVISDIASQSFVISAKEVIK
ncbi:MAG: ACT domain-containing protein [Oscillospiraceae bacterium]|nr:ACT domain-containing protein [Oscillospiraceae bacterium]MBR5251727.1 ACT domain-containing protein [Oscillospiraceae bacterium]